MKQINDPKPGALQMSTIAWNETADIYHRTQLMRGPPSIRAVHQGPLNWLIEVAVKGLEGPLDQLFIRTNSGVDFEPDEILALSQRSDRPKPKLDGA